MQNHSNIIKKLTASQSNSPKVSIYIPTHPKSTGDNVAQDKIRFKNAMSKVDEQVNGQYRSTIMRSLEELYENHDFWIDQKVSLGIFADSKSLHTVQLDVEIETVTQVSDEFMISPLLLANSIESKAYIFDINLNQPRLLLINGSDISQTEIGLVSMPDYFETDHEQSHQFHSTGNSIMHHGHGGAEPERQQDIDRYLHYVAKKVKGALNQKEAQLILAGDQNRIDQIIPLLDGLDILREQLHGNHSHLHKDELIDKARKLVRADWQLTIQQRIAESGKMIVAGKLKVQEALERNAVAELYVPIIRATADSVRSGAKQKYLIRKESLTHGLETLIKSTIDQGGHIQAVITDSTERPLIAANTRF